MSEERNLALYIAHRRKLVDYAGGIVGDAAQAEDVVQDAFLRFRGGTAGRLIDKPVAFLYRVVRNLALDRRRHLKREARYFQDTDESTTAEIAAASPSPEQEASDREALRRIRAAMDALPERTRVALEMHRIEGRSLREIADRLGLSVSMAQLLVVEGIRQCQRAL